MWVIEGGTLTNTDFSELPESAMTSPFPAIFWRTDGSSLSCTIFPELYEKPMAKPFPNALWRVEGGVLTHVLLPDYVPPPNGAFKFAEHLTNVDIPDSVTLIGAEAFRCSGLKEVSVPGGCAYSATSFPEGCTVTIRGLYGPLADSAGIGILDSQARKIYAKETDDG